MKHLLIILFATTLLGAYAHAEDKKISELAARYDYVGIVTHIRQPKWNIDGSHTRLSPVDPQKAPKGRILVGLFKNPLDEDFPLKGRLYIESWWKERHWDMAFTQESPNVWIGWDLDEDVRVRIIRKGLGYRRK